MAHLSARGLIHLAVVGAFYELNKPAEQLFSVVAATE